MKYLLVTGGAGFIGSNFIRYWLKHHPQDRVINLDALTYAGNLESLSDIADNPNYRFVQGDICDKEAVARLFEEVHIDTVVNFAAESHVDRSIVGPEAFITTNIYGTFTLLEVARKVWSGDSTACRFLHVSTDEVYGSLEPDASAFTEKTAFAPNSPYSASKASSDHLVRAYFHTHGLPVLTTNCSNNYGPYQLPEKLIPLIILNALEDKSLPVYGDGKNIRDWLHVNDHCRGIDFVLQKGLLGETYNIGGHNEWANIDIVKLICARLDELKPGSEPKKTFITYVEDRLGHDRRYAIDAGKMLRELEWKPLYTFEQGIEETIHWYLDNPSWWRRNHDAAYRKA
ncbi:dTDP-glucose 4,6-dehydratase [hydrothermal vent metagenome]|uniref:dTDP-glucose 4,6-dehydratase n=1 Tax=hydrothermal vent metagenome TaxID=652676 RepID=A0A3B0YZT0_9ZZZZ